MSDRINKHHTAKQVSEFLSCSLQNVYDIIKAGEPHATRIGVGGGGIRVSEEDLEAFLQSRKTGRTVELRRGPVELKHVKLQKPA